MRSLMSFVLLLGVQIGMGQITPNPRVAKKSSTEAYINKIEITDEFTVVSMQFVSKSSEEQLKEYLNTNPQEKEQLARINPIMRDIILQQMMQQMGSSSISIQPSSYLKAANGTKYRFVKATSIPVAPERQETEPGKKYFFKVYFSRLDPGVQLVDLIEHEQSEADGFHFWNFFGVEVNNPAQGGQVQELSRSEPKKSDAEPVTFLFKGKVLDALSNKPVSARIVCKVAGEAVPYDSLYTSRSGYYEFMLSPAAFVYEISAPGFETFEQSLNLSKWKSDLEQDFYLQPLTDSPPAAQPLNSTDFEMVDSHTIRLNNVYFPTGKAEIYNTSYRELDRLADFMKEQPDIKVEVSGHTDNQGDPDKNKELSLNRALAVKAYLVEQGIDSLRISCRGWGDTKPVADNKTEASRQKNRRVEVKIVE